MLWWDESLSTGVKEIDEQHKSIFAKLEEILALEDFSNVNNIDKILRYLINYSLEHFSYEERIMIEVHYSEFEKHRHQHTYFINELFKINKIIHEKGVSEKVIDALKLLVVEWLVNHIHTSDKDFVVVLKKST